MKRARRKALARWLIDCFRISDRRACRIVQVQRSTWHDRSGRDNQVALKQRIWEIAETRNRYVYLRIHALLRREGWSVNHKRIYRLQMRLKTPKRRVKAKLREDRQPAERINDCWCMDFMADQTFDGKKLRILTIVDNFSRVSPVIGVRGRYTGFDVVRTLEWATKRHGTPPAIRVDNGPEFISKELDLWAYANDVTLDFSRPGKPTDNAFIETFNARVRQECMNQHWFLSLADSRLKINRWRHEYNNDRPHSMLGYLAPAEYAEKHSNAVEDKQNLGQNFAHVVA